MGVSEILSQLKGGVLDAAHFELLKHAYELQEQNINQLKTNNTALRESNDHLKDSNEQLRNRVSELEQEVERLSGLTKNLNRPGGEITIDDLDELSREMQDVLSTFYVSDRTDLFEAEIIEMVDFGKIETQTILEELLRLGILESFGVSTRAGVHYFLGDRAKKVLAELKKSHRSAVDGN